MDGVTDQQRAVSGLFGALLVFGPLVLVTRAFSFAEFEFWPIVLALVGAFLLILRRPDLRFPVMSRKAWLKSLGVFALLWTSFAIKWDTELAVRSTVRKIISQAAANPDGAYSRWKGADVESLYRVRRMNPSLSEAFAQRKDGEEREAAAAKSARDKAAEAARRAEEKRRREAWEKNPLRYPVEFVELILVLLSMSGNPGH